MGKSTRNIRLVLEYSGGGYHGWQIQPGVVTVQEVVESCIVKLTQFPSRVTAAGRTDAGVHALQQVAHFHTPSRLSVQTLLRGLNALLPPDIRVLKADDLPLDFHARFSAIGKSYEYRIWNAETTSVFHHPYVWSITRPLDTEAMEEAACLFIGGHDFTSFRSVNCDARNPVREIQACGWQRNGSLLVFRVRADGFLRHMVRTIVGTLVEVGFGRRIPGDISTLLEVKDRGKAGITAPGRGLFLTSVDYPPPWEIRIEKDRDPLGWTSFPESSQPESQYGLLSDGTVKGAAEETSRTRH